MTMMRTRVITAMLAAGVLAASATAPADARRGGSFGSRGSRTYAAPRATQVAPGYTQGIDRSMTPRTSAVASRSQYGAPAAAPYGQGARPRFGLGSGLLAGVVTGGLLASVFGHGASGYGGAAGGGGGMLVLLIQLAIIGALVWLAVRYFRNRAPAPAGMSSRLAEPSAPLSSPPSPIGGAGIAPQPFAASPTAQTRDITLTPADQTAFEALLAELQDAFGHEDYARLRAITTPEIMSYLAEELSDNATHGRRNEVSATRLLDAEVSEAWNEADADFATIALRYESIDVVRDRISGAVLSGDPARPSSTTELWTFTRPSGAWATWKVSAIQEA